MTNGACRNDRRYVGDHHILRDKPTVRTEASAALTIHRLARQSGLAKAFEVRKDVVETNAAFANSLVSNVKINVLSYGIVKKHRLAASSPGVEEGSNGLFGDEN